MPNIKRLLSFGAITGVLVLVGFGCKGLSAEQVAATKPVTVEMWTVYDDVGTIRGILDSKYLKDRPYLRVNIRQLRADELYNRLVEALADDQGPDIISVNTRELGKYINRLQPVPASTKDTIVQVVKGQFQDTTNVTIAQRPMINGIQIQKEFVQTVEKDAMRGGKIYGLPLSLDVMAIYYNKDLLDRAGIPEPPKTWEEFKADVIKLTKFNKTTGKITVAGAALGTGANIPNSSDLLYILFTQSKIPFTDRSGRAVFNQLPDNTSKDQPAPGMEIIDFYTNYANPNRETYSWNDEMPNALDAFVNGQLAFFFGYSYQYQTIRSRAPQLNFDVIPMLQLNDQMVVNSANYSLLTVLQKAKHPNEAWTIIDFLAHSGENRVYLDKTKRPTAMRSYVPAQTKDPVLGPFASQVLTADSWYRGHDYDAANAAIQEIFTEWPKPAPEDEDIINWHGAIMNRAAQKVNQTL